jgi:hypothetical protein
MGGSKNGRKILKILGFSLYKIYKLTIKKRGIQPILPLVDVPSTSTLPLLSLITKQNFFYLNTFGICVVSGISIIALLKQLFDSATEILDQNPQKFPDNFPGKFPTNTKTNTKRVLALHLHSPFHIHQYVIFKEKNKNNSSSVHINRGEIGKIIERLDIWDFALVDFSIEIPDSFKNWNTKLIADKASNEAIVIVEAIKTKK